MGAVGSRPNRISSAVGGPRDGRERGLVDVAKPSGCPPAAFGSAVSRSSSTWTPSSPPTRPAAAAGRARRGSSRRDDRTGRRPTAGSRQRDPPCPCAAQGREGDTRMRWPEPRYSAHRGGGHLERPARHRIRACCTETSGTRHPRRAFERPGQAVHRLRTWRDAVILADT
jgi:hypothetical protein